VTKQKERPINGVTGVTLSHAAAVLRREVRVIDSLVRREKIVPVHGKCGRGGQYRLERDSLIVLAAAARLGDLRVPLPAIRRLAERLRGRLDFQGELAVVYAPEKEDVVEIGAGKTTLRDLIGEGATVELVAPSVQRAELEHRLLTEVEPRRRGRPKLACAWSPADPKPQAPLRNDKPSGERAPATADILRHVPRHRGN